MIFSRFTSFIFLTIFAATFSWRSIPEITRRKTKPPLLRIRKPLNVKFGMYLESIANFRETEMSFDVDLYMYLSWRDPFLAHNKSNYVMINDHSIRRQIWMPDLYFANARSARFHDVTVPNFSIFIAPDGTVAYSCRVTLTVACNLDLIHYPMDHQKCFIRILSYAYIASEMNVTWFQESPIRYNDEIELPEFVITKVSNGYCNGTYRYAVMESSYKIGQFSCLEGNIHLRRSIGYNLVQSFIPTGLIVIISWVSFWIDRRAVPARVTLSFTTLLSITTIGNGLRFGLPQVSYAKAIDYWFGACMLFIFCVLLEFAIVNSYMRQSEKYARLARKSADTESETFVDVDAINSLRSSQSKFMKKMQLQLQQNEIPEYKYNDLLKRNIMGENLESEQRLDCNAIELQYQGKSQGAMISSVYDNVNNEKCDDIEAIECENGESTKLLTTQYRDETLTKLLSPRVGASQSSTPPPQWSNKNTRAYPYTTEQYAKLAMRFSRRALLIDKICRYVFPALFILWNLVYWCYYLMLY